jgi:tripartite-type tricarboxylate transporter receptor subunit TctC
MIRVVKIAVLALGLVLGGSCLAQADAYPSKPVRFIVAFPPGNATDILARLFADKLSQTMKQSVFVENKPGAAGIIGTEFVAKAPPDGYTVLIGQSGALAVNPYLYKLSFDPQKDLAPVTLLITGHTVLVVGENAPYKSVKELIATARKQPGKLTYASYGAGHIAHLMGEMFKSAAGVDILHVPYKSGPIPDVIAGRVDMMFDSTAVVVPHIKSGKLRPLAVMGAKRSTGMPEVPSVAEELPGFDAIGWVGVMVPAGTPKDIIEKLNKEFVTALAAPDMRQRIQGMLFETGGGRPEEFGAFIKAQSERWGKVIREAGIKVE